MAVRCMAYYGISATRFLLVTYIKHNRHCHCFAPFHKPSASPWCDSHTTSSFSSSSSIDVSLLHGQYSACSFIAGSRLLRFPLLNGSHSTPPRRDVARNTEEEGVWVWDNIREARRPYCNPCGCFPTRTCTIYAIWCAQECAACREAMIQRTTTQ